MFHSWLRRLNQAIKAANRRTYANSYRPQLEAFEDRVVLSTIYWSNPASGDWETAGNWSSGSVPGPDDDVIIDVPARISITHDTGSDLVHSLSNNQNLVVTGGSSLTVTDTLSENGSLLVDVGSSMVANGTYSEAGTLTVLAGGSFFAAGAFSNFSGGTLTGGTYHIGGTFQFTGAAISTNAATIVLDAPASQIVDEANSDALAYFASNDVAGSFTIQNGRSFTTAGDFSNAGSLVLGPDSALTVAGNFGNSGSLSLLDGSSFTASGGYRQTGGSATLSNATLAVSGLVDLQGGALSGTGTINASVQNAGVIQVGTSSAAGLLTINGDYTQTATGVLNVKIGGFSPGTDYDQLAISGLATLGGTLNVKVINGLRLSPGDDFTILTYGSWSETTFATKNTGGVPLGAWYYFNELDLRVPRY